MGYTVLAVDDSAIMRNLVKQALEGAGHSALLGSDGREGLEIFEQSKVDIVVTDINMPVMDGIELIKAIRRINRQVPILALTSESDVDMRNRGVEAGANGWIIKPFQPAQFVDIVRQVIER